MALIGIRCPRCNGPVSIYWARDFRKPWWGAPAYRDRDWIIIKAKCYIHGKFKEKFNAFSRESWADDFADGIFRCMKCEEFGDIVVLLEKGQWLIFKINCPVHGLTDTKKIITSLYYIANQVLDGGSYEKVAHNHPPSTYTLCPGCGHIVAPGLKYCEVCGASVMPK